MNEPELVNKTKYILLYISNNLLIRLYCVCMCFLYSCEPENNSVFKIHFSDGNRITDSDIIFYDSSSHCLFLKNEIKIKAKTDFSVIVNKQTIYRGVVQSKLDSNSPFSPFYINEVNSIFGKNIIEIQYNKNYPPDLRNDPQIINSLKSRNFLRNGISCNIDSIVIENAAIGNVNVSYNLTIINNDNYNYYVINKGFVDVMFMNIDTYALWYLKSNPTQEEMPVYTLNNFSLLKSNSKLTRTVKFLNSYRMEPGYYQVTCTILHGGFENLSINQDSGRIWLGKAISVIDSLRID
ncbi:MAG TPA: hypothetical protein VIO15_08610 [Bacteroidales bacterium]